MHPIQLKRLLNDAMLGKRNGHERSEMETEQLQLDRVGYCPRRTYNEIMYGRVTTASYRRFQYLRKIFSQKIVELLKDISPTLFTGSHKIIAFGGEVVGNGNEFDHELVVIKTTTSDKIAEVADKGPFPAHATEMQAAMHFSDGRWQQGHLIYVAKDTGELWVEGVSYNPEKGEEAERRTEQLLNALHTRQPPDCTCGLCQR